MQRLIVFAAAAAISAGSGVLAAQERPNFSGRWASADSQQTGRGGAAAAPGRGARGGGGGGGRGGTMGSGWGADINITQDANNLTLQYAFFGRGDMQPPLRFIFALDGSESRNSVMMGRGIEVLRSRAAWDGAKLVITTLYPLPEPLPGGATTTETRQALSLTSPTELLVETTRAGVLGGAETTVRTTYRKAG
jgi:hypothetical protein